MNILKFIFSFIYPVTVEKTSSVFNPLLEVRLENGKYVLNAANANYSFGSLHQIFLKAFQKIKIGERGIKNVLLLGFGAGSVPELLFEEFKINCTITAVEVDDKVIELGKKYFNTERFEKLELICADALEFVQQCNSKFDLIVLDLFIDNKVPSQFESPGFLLALKKLMGNKSILLFNKIVEMKDAESFDRLHENFKKIFGETDFMDILGNRVLMTVSE
ncbi:MAG TPA: methyltransferase domain-containing protein [Bacteroidia bacterium]|nr:methyltransferase domain-containing protein [Bacteroidia bacterium]